MNNTCVGCAVRTKTSVRAAFMPLRYTLRRIRDVRPRSDGYLYLLIDANNGKVIRIQPANLSFMKKFKTQAIITPLIQAGISEQAAEKDELIFDEKHLKFGFLNVAYSNIRRAEIIAEGPLFFKQYYLVIYDEKRRYQFGPFRTADFLETLPIPFDK